MAIIRVPWMHGEHELEVLKSPFFKAQVANRFCGLAQVRYATFHIMGIQNKIAMMCVEKAGQNSLRIVKESLDIGLSHRRKIRNVHFYLRVVKDSTRT